MFHTQKCLKTKIFLKKQQKMRLNMDEEFEMMGEDEEDKLDEDIDSFELDG